MPINYPQFGRLSAAELGGLGGIDLAKAIQSGLQNANLIQETRYKPKQLKEELYAKQLANKINEAKAQYAAENELANLDYTRAGTGNLGAQAAYHRGQLQLLPYEMQFKIAQAQRQRQLANQPILSPEQKAEMEAQAKSNVKTRSGLEENIPQASEELERVNRAIQIAQKHPDWFGSATPGFSLFSGPEARKRSINDPEYGELESIIEGLVGPKAKELSGSNRVLASSFGLAGRIKPSFSENQKNAIGKLKKVQNELLNSLRKYGKQYQIAGGRQEFFIPQTEFVNEKEFHDYMKTLTPAQQQLVINSIEKRGL